MVSLVGGQSPRVQLLVQGQQGVTFSCNEKWHKTKVGWILNGILFYPKNPANSEP